MSNKEANILSTIQCPIDKCGRKFEDHDKMITHMQRRHPEYNLPIQSSDNNISQLQQQQIQQQSQQQIQQQLNIPSGNPTRKRSNSRENIGQQQQTQQLQLQSQLKTNSQKQIQIESIDKSIQSTKEMNLSRLQRPPTPKSSQILNNVKSPSIINNTQQINNTSDSLRRSQDLFRKTQENTQLIERTATSKDRIRPSSSSSSTQQTEQSKIKISKPILKSNSLLKQESNNDKQIIDDKKTQQPLSDPSLDLIKSIQFYIKEAEKREANKIEQESQILPKEEVLSENEDESQLSDQNNSTNNNIKKNQQQNKSRPSTATARVSSSNGSSSVFSNQEQQQQKQVSIQEILQCKKKITNEYLLSKSSNECDDIGFIESLNLNEQNLVVFEDGLTDAKFDIMVSLQYLSLSKNQLVNIISINKFSASLLELNINFNNISDINPLYECIHLQKLYASHNFINSITCLKKLKNLQIISLFNNKINSCVDTLKELQNLQEIDLGNNPCSLMSNYKNDVLCAVKVKILDQIPITPQDIVIATNSKLAQSHNNRPTSAPQNMQTRQQPLSASVIVNQQRQQNDLKQNKNQSNKNSLTNSNNGQLQNNQQEIQTSLKIQTLEKNLSSIQQRQQELREVIRQTKKINKSLQSEIEEKEKENLVLREYNEQIETTRQQNKTLLRKIAAYESTIILHQEGPEELKKYLTSLSNQVKSLEQKNAKLHEENEELENMEEQFINGDGDDQNDSYDSDYNPDKINELLRRSTAAFSQIKSDLKILHKAKI